jgi:hypothetical protein
MLSGVAGLLEEARRTSARAVNAIMTATYREIGRRIVEFEQGGKNRAGYGEELIARLSADLTARFGRGFGPVNLSQMRKFYQYWLPERIFQTPSEKFAPAPAINGAPLQNIAARFPLPWSHYVRLMSVKTSEARAFYEAEALRGGWTGPQLDRQIASLFYERTALSRNKSAMLKKGEKPNLPNKVLAAEYKTVLPSEKTLIEEIDRTRNALEARRKDA